MIRALHTIRQIFCYSFAFFFSQAAASHCYPPTNDCVEDPNVMELVKDVSIVIHQQTIVLKILM